jgi:hypothetical protein
MEWWHWLIIVSAGLILVGQLAILVFAYLITSGLAQIINSQKIITDSMQTLSGQLSDMEEQNAETKADIRKNTQYFVNFAKGMKPGGSDKPWYTGM